MAPSIVWNDPDALDDPVVPFVRKACIVSSIALKGVDTLLEKLGDSVVRKVCMASSFVRNEAGAAVDPVKIWFMALAIDWK